MVFWLIVVTALLGGFLLKIRKDFSILAMARKIKAVNGTDVDAIAPTAEGSSIFGNNFDFIGATSEDIFAYMRRMAIKYKKSYLQYMVASPIYNVVTPEDAELIFNDINLITKGILYKFLHPFLETGLLTTTGQKWHSRRKMLTPAFHFNILELFLEIFKEESLKFKNMLDAKDGQFISLTDLIPRLTLNSICETALGVKLDNLADGNLYRENLNHIEAAFVKRLSNPMYISDFAWKYFGNSKMFDPFYDAVHEFSSNIIKKRRSLFQEIDTTKEVKNEDDFYLSKKQRYAMLDTLLIAEKNGLIDHSGICEEVDTFIFEGFDTTSMGLIYGIMNLALHPEMQEKCFEEVDSLIDDDLSTLTISSLSKLEYLDRFVKENIRLYPPVPLISREVVRDTALSNNLILPKGTQIQIHIYDINRSPKYYKNPDQFDPDRFLPENSAGRHPYAYVPFSAGSRNCIGQKFAMAEMKTVLIYFLKNFKATPVQDPKDYRYETGFLLRMSQNIKIRVEKRKK